MSTTLEIQHRNKLEDEIRAEVDKWSDERAWLTYLYLHNGKGCTMQGIEFRIEKLVREAVKKL